MLDEDIQHEEHARGRFPPQRRKIWAMFPNLLGVQFDQNKSLEGKGQQCGIVERAYVLEASGLCFKI